MTENIIIKPSVQKRFDSFMAHGRVLFFSAPCGFGKTVLADALLRGRNVLRQSAADPDCAIPPSAQDWDILLIDDLQLMQEEAGQQALCELIRSSPERHFVLLSRGVPPGCLTAFQYTGLMTVLEADDLLFDADDVRRLFQLSGANVTDSEIDGILKESVGYPLGVAITARCMSRDKPWTPELVARVFHEVFLYFETAIYRRFDLPVRRFLLELAPFESFDLEMARMVSGDPRAGERLDWLLRYTTMLRYDDCQRFHFWSGFRAFLRWEMEREYTEEKRKALFSRGGLYYELKEDYAHALECYTSGGDHSKVSELLVRNAELHPGMGHYAEMEKYYRSLPEAEILASPSLMQGMSMLCALAMDYEGSERWYGELQAFAERCGRQDAAGKQARSRLAWLDISLPQRGVNGLTETIPAVFRLLMNKEVTLPSFSVTSALPSIMNGGKDFSAWSKKDDLLYKTLRLPVEAVLGRDGVGLADCAIAESKFEKGGFMLYCSYGNGYRMEQSDKYKQVLLEGANSLASRFNPVVGCIRSWDHNGDKWQYPVIIDNMMNLEFLFWATKASGDSTFYKIAVTHADNTMKYHFRKDYSSYHVIDYDTITGNVRNKHTHQGYAHESAWARGQAWGLYGYTMCFRETGDRRYLNQAEQIASFIFHHPNLPSDLIPYWDYNDPETPASPRDVSAATITASALYELSAYSDKGGQYKKWADTIMENLTESYRVPLNQMHGFLLHSSTGHKPAGTEIDVPIVYADYYFLEALLRKKNLEE